MAGRLRSDINVTPLVDIVLVLLIVFITLVPALPRVLATTLPHIGGAGSPPLLTRLTLAADGGLDLDGAPITLAELPGRIRLSRGRVVLRVHPSLTFQRVARILDVVKAARPEAVPSMIAAPEDI